MLYINGNQIKTSYFSNTEVRVKDFMQHIKSINNYIELKYETERLDYKINDDLMQLYFLKQEFESMHIEVSLVLWSMPYQRMDHKNVDDLYTLPYVANFLKSLNFKKILVIEPHSEKTAEFLGDVAKIVYPVATWIKSAVKAEKSVNSDVVIVFPDKGAYERYKDMLDADVKTCVFTKKRNNYTNDIEAHYISQGEITNGSTCYIIDDICSSGQTLLDVACEAMKSGAKDINIIVGHCEDKALKGQILKQGSPVNKMYTSKSMISTIHPKIEYMDIPQEIIENWLFN